MKKVNFEKIKKVLVIKQSAIGDVVLATPVVENLKHNLPKAEIVFLTQKYCKEALTGNPYINKILTYDLALDSGWCLIKNIRKQRYDMVIDLFCNPRTALITFLSRAKYKVGFRFRGRTYAYNIKVKRRSAEVHNVEFNIDALRALGMEIVTSKPVFALNAYHDEFAEKFFRQNNFSGKKVIGINPAGTWPTKVWYAEKFVELMNKLNEQFAVLLFWGNDREKEIASSISKSANNKGVLIPQTDLKYMAALIRKCAVFVTNDTGPMHIASTMGVNIVSIFGPTNSHLQGPLNRNSIILKNDRLSCLGCNLTRIEDCPNEHKCMKELSVDAVFDAIMSFVTPKK